MTLLVSSQPFGPVDDVIHSPYSTIKKITRISKPPNKYTLSAMESIATLNSYKEASADHKQQDAITGEILAMETNQT